MVVVDTLIGVLSLCLLFIIVRWVWFRLHKRKIRRMRVTDEAARFDRGMGDEDDRLIHGKVITKLRAQVVNGQVLIHWLIHPDFCHKGFLLTAKVKRNDAPWEAVPFEPHEDSGSWNELLQYGDAHTYLFVVKKTYRVFMGFLSNDQEEIVFDQISFTVRNGRYFKDVKAFAKDKRELMEETNQYKRLESEYHRIAGNSRPPPPSLDEATARFHKEYKATSTLAETVRKEKAAVESDVSLSPAERQEKLAQIDQIAEGIRLEEN